MQRSLINDAIGINQQIIRFTYTYVDQLFTI